MMKHLKYLIILFLLPNIVYGDSFNIDNDTNISDRLFNSSVGGENSIYISGGNSTISNSTIAKSGNSDTFSNNSGVLVDNEAYLKLDNSSITTSGNNSPAVSVFDSGRIEITNGNIITKNSPLVYVSNVGFAVFEDSTLKADNSTGIIVDRDGYVDLKNVKFSINASDKNILIYDSINGDGVYDDNNIKIIDSEISTNKGSLFSINNVGTNIELRNTKFKGSYDKFIEVVTTKNDYNKHGSVSLNIYDMEFNGDIDIGTNSNGYLLFSNSIFEGSINNKNSGNYISLNMSPDSIIILKEDSYINSISSTMGDINYSNIFLNGHKMFVNGKKVRGNNGKFLGKDKEGNILVDNSAVDRKNRIISFVIIGLLLIIAVVIFIIVKIRKRAK